MKRLIIIRHPEYGDTGDLLPSSKEDFSDLFNTVVKETGLGDTFILTSPSPRTMQTTNIVDSAMGGFTPITQMLELRQKDYPSHECYEKIFNAIKEQMATSVDTLVISTHGEYTGGLLNYTFDRLKGRSLRENYFMHSNIEKGQMIVFDFEKEKAVTMGPKKDDPPCDWNF